jgi:hypothetical protein
MAIIKQVQYSGSVRTSTLSGNIELNEASGELIIRNGAHVLTRINSEGFTYSDMSGLRRIRTGLNPKDGSIGQYISKPTVDVIEALQ